MNSFQIGEAIADACKWTRDTNLDCDCLYRTADGRAMFNPASCLNAMHEAEKAVIYPRSLALVYLSNLQDVANKLSPTGFGDDTSRTLYCSSATAAQRSEAFLRTIGRWSAALSTKEEPK
jgi:hypothetical protein